MSTYVLKLIAIITMLFDHSGYVIYDNISWMNFIGRIAFPIFAFQISQGYTHTHNLKKYFIRLIIFALISQIFYAWFDYCLFSKISLNIIFTLILGLLSITIYEFIVGNSNISSNGQVQDLPLQSNKSINSNNSLFNRKLLGIIIVIFIALFADLFEFDYGFYGVFIIFLFYLFRNNKLLMNISITVLTIIYYMPFFMASSFDIRYIGLFFFSLIPLIFINLYNGQKGKDHKMLFYIFYPVHLLVLCLIYTLLH